MSHLMRALLLTGVITGLVASAGIARAAGEVSCEITKAGKKEVVKVATEAECTKMGGKVVTPEKKK